MEKILPVVNIHHDGIYYTPIIPRTIIIARKIHSVLYIEVVFCI